MPIFNPSDASHPAEFCRWVNTDLQVPAPFICMYGQYTELVENRQTFLEFPANASAIQLALVGKVPLNAKQDMFGLPNAPINFDEVKTQSEKLTTPENKLTAILMQGCNNESIKSIKFDY